MNQEVETKLFENTRRHCAAFFWAPDYGRIYFRNRGEDYIEKQGTLTFVKYQNECYAITNRHVLEPEEDDNWEKLYEKKSLMIALDHYSFFGIAPIFLSPRNNKPDPFYPPNYPKDIAVFPISRNVSRFEKANKEPVLLPDELPQIKCGDLVLSVGFPGKEREIISEKTTGHRLAHIFGTVVSIEENSILIQDQNSKRDKDISIGGMSGGPIFTFDENTGTYEFAGIIHQGKGNKRLNAINQEEIGNDIWIFGYPLDCKRLGDMLNSKYVLKY